MERRGAVTVVHPTGAPFATNLVRALWEADLLSEVFTSFCFKQRGRLAALIQTMPTSIREPLVRELRRRSWIPDDSIPVRMHWSAEVFRMLLVKARLTSVVGLTTRQLVDFVYRDLDLYVAKHVRQNRRERSIVYGYEDCAADTFQEVRNQDGLCIYDLPIMFYQMSAALQAEEAERFPEFRQLLVGRGDQQDKLDRKQRELDFAHHVVVASSITRDSVIAAGKDPSHISVVPYGAPLEYFSKRSHPPEQFRVLFVGRITPRKGVHYLLQAWKELKLKGARLTLVGVNEMPEEWMSKHLDGVEIYPSIPHTDLERHYHGASVLVLPSLVEGFGMVLLEAMACGVPIIATPHTAAPDLITDKQEGFIVPIRDQEALREKIQWCFENQSTLSQMGEKAFEAAQRYSWNNFRTRIVECVGELL